MPAALIVGYGDIGQRLARRLHASGWSTETVGRRPQSARSHHIADLDRPDSLIGLPTDGRIVFYLAPPAGDSGDQRMRHFLAHAQRAGLPRRIVYISTSGVYGDCQGAWVDESHPPNPQTEQAQRRLDAEQQLARFGQSSAVAVIVLRVAGIYARERLPLARIRRGEPVICPEQAPWSNRIHAEDLVTACIAAAERGRPGEIYNVCDDHPSSLTDYIYRVADAFALPRPPCISMAEAEQRLSPGMLRYLRESRRLDNRRLREELGVALCYPDLEAALKRMPS